MERHVLVANWQKLMRDTCSRLVTLYMNVPLVWGFVSYVQRFAEGALPCLGCLGVCVQCGLASGCITDSVDVVNCFKEASECKDFGSFDQPASGPVDPNEKHVVAEKFIQPDQLLVYPIHFENIGNVEARDVFITDHLDPNLDASTLNILTPGAG